MFMESGKGQSATRFPASMGNLVQSDNSLSLRAITDINVVCFSQTSEITGRMQVAVSKTEKKTINILAGEMPFRFVKALCRVSL